MTLAEVVEQKKEALRVADVARILDISIKQIYKMAAKGQIPALKIANCVRFDPHIFADWLRGQSMNDATDNRYDRSALSTSAYLARRPRRRRRT